MAQQFLYDLGILSVRVQESPKSVPKGAIRNLLRHLGTLQSRLAIISPQRSRPIRLFGLSCAARQIPNRQTLIFAYHGIVDYKLGVILGVTMFLGAVVGAHVTLRLPAVWLRRVFITAVIALAAKMMVALLQ
jgi:hypothetical protein